MNMAVIKTKTSAANTAKQLKREEYKLLINKGIH